MSQNVDPSLGDVIRSVHATGEDRFGVEHEHNDRDHPAPDHATDGSSDDTDDPGRDDPGQESEPGSAT